MNKNKRMIHLLNAGLLMAGLSLTHAMPAMAAMQFERPAGRVSMKPDQTDGNGIEFKLSETNGIYTVYMRPNATPASPNATISAQVTVKVPHGVAAPSEITSLISGTSWDLTSHDDAPAEAPDSDYLSFSLDFPGGDYRAFNWNSNTEQAVFSFKAGAGGHLMETCDAFAPPNSRSASVGNEITVLGYGDGSKSAYVGNYDQAHDCPTSEQAVSVVSLVAHSSVADIVKANGLVTYTFTISNSGLRTASALSLQVSQSGLANMKSASNSFGVANPVLYPNQSATWQLGELSPNAEGSVTLTMIAPAGNDTLLTQASVSALNDNSSLDNTAQLRVAVLADPIQPQATDYKTYLPLTVR